VETKRRSPLFAALLALEQGLEFVLNSPLGHRSIVAGSDTLPAIRAVLRPKRPGRRSALPENLTDLVSDVPALRFDRTHTRANQEARALARLALAYGGWGRRSFMTVDDVELAEYLRGNGKEAPDPGDLEPHPPGMPDFFALPLDPPHLKRMMDGLPFREREMIRLRFGMRTGRPTFGEIGGILKLSTERVRQIIAKGLRRLWTRVYRDDPFGATSGG
jgi:hypothetical protein